MRLVVKTFLKRLILSFFLCFCIVSVFAQNNNKLMREGSKYYEKGNHRAAATYFEQALTDESNLAYALYMAGRCYMTFDKEKAADYLYRAYEIDPDVDIDILFWLGKAEHVNYNFDKAIQYFKDYQKNLPKRDKYQHDQASKLIQHARNAKHEIQYPKNIFVRNLGPSVNTMYSEHSPAISSDDNYLVFTSRSKGVTGGKESGDGEYFEDIFETSREGGGNWRAPRGVAGSLNSPGHEASIQLFDNDTKMLLYSSENYGDIMVAERQVNGTWGIPKSISDKVNSKFYESDAFITADGNTLFFSTNLYSKGAHLDIYKVEKQANGTWGNPVSLGNVINTPYDEDSPFLAGDGTLYFSSRGHNTMGGYDIFKSTFDQGTQQWTKPVNMGVPINSPDDDTYYRLSHDGRYAYLSSYRIGGYGEKDIYTVNFQNAAQIAGKVFSMHDSAAVAGVEVKFVSTSRDKEPLVYQESIKEAHESYVLNILAGYVYQVEIIKDNMVISKQEVNVPLFKNDEVKLTNNFYIDYGAIPKAPEKLVASAEPAKPVVLPEPEKLIAVVPDEPVAEEEALVQPVVIDLEKAVKTEIRKKAGPVASVKVKPKTIKALPKPVIALEPEEPEEVAVVEEVPEQPTVTELQKLVKTEISKKTLAKAEPKVKPSTFKVLPKHVIALEPDDPEEMEEVAAEKPVETKAPPAAIAKAVEKPTSNRRAPARSAPESEEDKTVAFESIYYDVGSYKLRPASIETLDRIVKMMQDDKEVRIKVEGYTMVEVVSDYSRNLSRNRAKSAYDYLVRKGISPSRLVLSTYNNKTPITANTSEESMQMNRMTRFVYIPKEIK